MRKALALAVTLTLVAVAVSGCSDGGEGTGNGGKGSSSTTSSGTNATSNSTTTSSGSPPTVMVVASPANGSAPLNVTFNLTVDDPDGGAIGWTAAFGDGNTTAGNGTNASVNHTYAAAGNYTATFNVSDAGGLTTTASATVEVRNGTGAGGGAKVTVVARWQAGTGPTAWRYELQFCEAGPWDGLASRSFTIPPEGRGRPYVATITAAQGAASIQGWGFIVSDPGCGTADDDYDSKSATGAAPITGTLGATWSYGAVYSTGGADLTMTMTIG